MPVPPWGACAPSCLKPGLPALGPQEGSPHSLCLPGIDVSAIYNVWRAASTQRQVQEFVPVPAPGPLGVSGSGPTQLGVRKTGRGVAHTVALASGTA